MDLVAEKTLQNQFAQLPQGLQEFLVSDQLQKDLGDLFSKHQIQEIGLRTAVENELIFTLLGLESLNDFAERLLMVGVPTDTTEEFERDIVENIIAPISDELADFLQKQTEGEDSSIREESAPTKPQTQSFETETSQKVSEDGNNRTSAERVKELLRQNSKTVNIKNLIDNLE